MSDKPTPKPQSGRKVTLSSGQGGTHLNPAQGGKVKMTSPQIKKMGFPAKGKGCELQAADRRDEAKFNRNATKNWNKTRPHIEANKAANEPMKVPDPVTPSTVKPPECAASYNGHRVAGR